MNSQTVLKLGDFSLQHVDNRNLWWKHENMIQIPSKLCSIKSMKVILYANDVFEHPKVDLFGFQYWLWYSIELQSYTVGFFWISMSRTRSTIFEQRQTGWERINSIKQTKPLHLLLLFYHSELSWTFSNECDILIDTLIKMLDWGAFCCPIA